MPRLGASFAPWIAVALLLAVLLAVPPAAAQTGGQAGAPTPLRIETRELEREVGAAQEALGGLGDSRAAAVLQNRLIAIEEELRRLTGRIEEAEFHERQTRDRIDRLVADLDRRLAMIEQRPVGPAGAAGAASDETDLDELALDAPPVGESAPPRDGATLGTIPRDTVPGIPVPSSEGPAGALPATALAGGSPARFTAALDLLQTGDYGTAEIAFARWLEDFPDDPQAPVASYWLGEAQLAQDDHANAAATFAANYRSFGPDAPRAADNLLKLGTALAAMGDTTRACQTFSEMDRRYQNVASGLRQALERERRAAGCA
jgi:tol-pal system protein YbgF